MDRVGNYRNPQIKVLLDRLIKEEKYGQYKPLIDEIIQRRTFQYNFSVDRIENELKNLVENLDGFEMADEQKISEIGEGTIAAYSKKDKKIYINAKDYKEESTYLKGIMPDIKARRMIGHDFFHFITHEIYHAITQHPNKTSGIENKLEYIDENAIVGIGLNEIVTESATTRTVLYMTPKERDSGGYMPTRGYQALTNTSALLASIIGTSENELLSHSLNDFNEFEEFVFSCLPESMEKYDKERIINSIIFKTDLLNSKAFFSKNEALPASYPKYYSSLVDMAITCMKEEQKEPTKENVGAMYYRAAKISAVLKASVQDYIRRGFINEQEGKIMLSDPELTGNFHELREVIFDTYKTCKGNAFEGKTSEEVEQYLLQDFLQDPEFRSKKDKLYLDDCMQRGNWDNSVFLYSYNVIESELERFEQRTGNNKVLNVNEQIVEQVLGNINNPNSLVSHPQKDDSNSLEER